MKSYRRIAEAFLSLRAGAWPMAPSHAESDAFLARPSAAGAVRAAGTRNQEIAALRALGRFAHERLGWPRSPLCDMPFLREPRREAAVLSAAELGRLFRAVAARSDEVERARDLAIVAVLSQAGLRVGELCALDLGQLDLGAAVLVAVRGKGGTLHDVALNSPTVTLLARWLRERDRMAESGEKALFVSSRGTRIGVRTIQKLFVRLRGQIGTAKKVSPHTCRHATATLLFALGVDVVAVKDVMRHSRIDTTMVYLHALDGRRREAAERLGTTVPAEILDWSKPAATEQERDEKTVDVQDAEDELGQAA